MDHTAYLMIQQLITQLPTEILGAALVAAAAAAWRSWRRHHRLRKSGQKQWTTDSTRHNPGSPEFTCVRLSTTCGAADPSSSSCWTSRTRPERRCEGGTTAWERKIDAEGEAEAGSRPQDPARPSSGSDRS